jgi:hypothetical protein
MLVTRHVPRSLGAAALCCLALASRQASAADTRVLFDIPDKIECHDVTPEKCAAAHPNLKVIEAKFRISASFVTGTDASVIDFLYMITSPERRMKIQDYLPNTTLESTAAEDTIEIADTTESTQGATEEAKVAYKILTLGATKSQTAKRTESGKYKQIVSKALVLASGTTNREHGVFFKLRPSKTGSLEGAKEFTFLAVVPKTWRGDWCTVVCAARAEKKSLLSSTTALAGIDQAHVGLYMAGDHEAGDLAEKLCEIQEANGGALAKQMAKEATRQVATMHAASTGPNGFAHYEDWLLHGFAKLAPHSKAGDGKLESSEAAILDIQERLSKLSGE